jgi:hypothetical protein
MAKFSSNLRSEVQAVTFPLRHKARHRLRAFANDVLERTGRPPRFEEGVGEHWRRVLARSASTLAALPSTGSPRVLFGSMFGGGLTRVIDSTLAMALRLRGATSWVLACDRRLPACEWNPLGNFEPPPGEFGPGLWKHASLHACSSCMVKFEDTHALPGLDRVSLGDFTDARDLESAQALSRKVELGDLRGVFYKDVQVGEHAYASLLRATLRGVPLEDDKTRWMGRRFLASAIALVDAGDRLLARLEPDRFVVSDGVYLTSGTLSELARKRGVHVVVHGAPYRKGTIWLSHDECYHRALINEKNNSWEALDMTPERTHVADEYLSSKHFAARDYTTYHVDSIKDGEAIRKELSLDERPIVSAFTNVLWDAQLYYRFGVYPNMLEWLFDTIRFFGTRKDVQFVIRVHPGEARGAWPTNQPLLPELERAFPTLPENVKIVQPESKVSSYVLGAMSRAALVYGARVGVELVILGTPVIVAGEAFMRGKGFTFDPASRDEYLALLDRVATIERASETEKARARKWYYHYFFRMMMPFPFYDADAVGQNVPIRLGFSSLDELGPGKDPVLDLVCRGIIDGKTAFEWDEWDDPSALRTSPAAQ